MYFVCSMPPTSVSSVRRIYRASEPSAHVVASHERLLEKTVRVSPSFERRAEVAGERIFPISGFGCLQSCGSVTLPPLAGCCIGSKIIGPSVSNATKNAYSSLIDNRIVICVSGKMTLCSLQTNVTLFAHFLIEILDRIFKKRKKKCFCFLLLRYWHII